jgi:hypothetical protein
VRVAGALSAQGLVEPAGQRWADSFRELGMGEAAADNADGGRQAAGWRPWCSLMSQ